MELRAFNDRKGRVHSSTKVSGFRSSANLVNGDVNRILGSEAKINNARKGSI